MGVSMNSNNKKIGIIGGGQLGKMMILEAKKMGFYVVIVDPVLLCPSHSIVDEHIVADFHDEEALRTLASKVDVITYEFEHIGVAALKKLEEEGYVIYPSVASLETIQNKYTQKNRLQQCGLTVPRFNGEFFSLEDLRQGIIEFGGYPVVLKTCTGGYDGKGNAFVNTEEELGEAFEQLGSGTLPLMIEEVIPFIKEISVLACRGVSGEIVVYPVAENIHENHILIETRVPAQITDKLQKKAMNLAHKVMEAFEGVGMFCVEMFVTADEVLINEVAPRPHNSGHYTIEGCVTSQFEQHIRAVTELPLGEARLLQPTVMRNVLGEIDYKGKAVVHGMVEALSIPEVRVHLYGKEMTAPKRKMGHITATALTLEEAVKRAEQAAAVFKIKA